jgi:hypothetical protein
MHQSVIGERQEKRPLGIDGIGIDGRIILTHSLPPCLFITIILSRQFDKTCANYDQ